MSLGLVSWGEEEREEDPYFSGAGVNTDGVTLTTVTDEGLLRELEEMIRTGRYTRMGVLGEGEETCTSQIVEEMPPDCVQLPISLEDVNRAEGPVMVDLVDFRVCEQGPQEEQAAPGFSGASAGTEDLRIPEDEKDRVLRSIVEEMIELDYQRDQGILAQEARMVQYEEEQKARMMGLGEGHERGYNDCGAIVGGGRRRERNPGSSGDDSDSDCDCSYDEDEEDDDDEDDFGGRKRAKKTKKKKDIFDTSKFKKRKVQGSTLCPPPLPPRVGGRGRKGKVQEVLMNNVNAENNNNENNTNANSSAAEVDMELACQVFKSKEIARTILPNGGQPLTISTANPLNLGLKMLEESDSQRIELLKNLESLKKIYQRGFGPLSKVMTRQALRQIKSSELSSTTPFNLKQILTAEMLTMVIKCVGEKQYGSPNSYKNWHSSLAEAFRGDERLKGVVSFTDKPFSETFSEKEEEIDGERPITYDSYGLLLHRIVIELRAKVFAFKLAATNKAMDLSIRKQEIRQAMKDNYLLMEKFQNLHAELSAKPSKMDEMSITGIKRVKIMMEPPYLKRDDGLEIPVKEGEEEQDEETEILLQYRRYQDEKQKWTVKDIQALKVVIKEYVTKRILHNFAARHAVQMQDAITQHKEEMAMRALHPEQFVKPAAPRKRGRPRRCEKEKWGRISVLADERAQFQKKLKKMSFDNILKSEGGAESYIEWRQVAQELMIRTRKIRRPDDCMLIYKHDISPKVNSKRFTKAESSKISMLKGMGLNWTQIANEINRDAMTVAKGPGQLVPLRTEYQLFLRYRSQHPPKEVEWTISMDNTLRTAVSKYPGDWQKVAATINHDCVSSKVAMERYKKVHIPLMKNGAFSRLEDCLLLLAMERCRDFIIDEGNFGPLLGYLPWRLETTWRDRVHNLFNDWIVPWTIEEDRQLLDLAKKMKRNWQKISEQFTSFKNRKGCLTRFNILMKNLGPGKFPNLEEYHAAYSMTRYNVFQYTHLDEVLLILKKVQGLDENKFKNVVCNIEGTTNKRISEEELSMLLLTYNRKVIGDTIASLEKYVKERGEYWDQWMKERGQIMRTFDRRTFHPDDPQSVASAIHIRGIKLRPKQSLAKKLNDFELGVYEHYNRFTKTKPLKSGSARPYLPPAWAFYEWDEVNRILEPAPKQMLKKTNVDVACSQKWLRLLENRKNKNNKEEVKVEVKGKKKAPATIRGIGRKLRPHGFRPDVSLREEKVKPHRAKTNVPSTAPPKRKLPVRKATNKKKKNDEEPEPEEEIFEDIFEQVPNKRRKSARIATTKNKKKDEEEELQPELENEPESDVYEFEEEDSESEDLPMKKGRKKNTNTRTSKKVLTKKKNKKDPEFEPEESEPESSDTEAEESGDTETETDSD